MVIEIPIVAVSKWHTKPLFDYFDEIKSYMIIIKSKRDCRRIKLLMKAARKAIVKETKIKTGVKPVVKFKMCKYEKEN